jgi:hypothetical protein
MRRDLLNNINSRCLDFSACSFLACTFSRPGMPITDVFKEDIGIGGVISLLW